MHPRPGTTARRAALAAPLLAALLAGCGGGDGLPEAQGQNYISGDGTVVQTPAAERGGPVTFTGTGVDGESIDLAQLRGQVVLLNTWFASCGPCREEAPALQQVWEEYSGRGVRFVGINTYDTANVARSFNRTYSITYPSVLDAASGQAMLALRGVAPQATPTTVVLDAEGRVAARVSGPATAATLSGLLDDAGAAPAPEGAAEGAAPAGAPA
ncbi:TlpA family protein disulfide reductase [Kineococcus indalonis]|uniref:TlpA family protein disulfide reductase n=1 Tax=Kineococcus indalonis TaxID=2696566 RepID=UPI001412FDD2|nr:TlpA disulfide reductase family protein [Kineococcus indalonis]NAZ86456.1 redoxin domain-containing protein [Kineococcus indalonis]